MKNVNETRIFKTGDVFSCLYFLVWKYGHWVPGDESELLNGDIWKPLPEDPPSNEILLKSEVLQTKPCPKCSGVMKPQKVNHIVKWQNKSKEIRIEGWLCPGTLTSENPEFETIIENNCGHVILETGSLAQIECERLSLKEFKLFDDAESLVQFFQDNPGPWENLTDPNRRIIGWECKTTCQYVGMNLSSVKSLNQEWKHHFRTEEDRSKFPEWASEAVKKA